MYSAIILDVPSIQKFVFGNNKMRLNIGASCIIRDLYRQTLGELGISIESSEWYPANKTWPAVLYEGGGNVVILCKNKTESPVTVYLSAERLLRETSEKILEKFPGLQLAFGINDEFDPDGDFKGGMAKLHADLKEKKNKHFSQTAIPIQSLAEVCSFNMLPAVDLKKLGQDLYPISKLGTVQWEAEEEESKAENQPKVYEFLKENFDGRFFLFPNELDKLGQQDESSYVSVVHIDGNSLGNRFAAQTSYTGLQTLSREVTKEFNGAVKDAMKDFIKCNHKNWTSDLGYDLVKVKVGEITKTYLPFRPLLLSGDDLTFVCHGKLGILLAEFILKELKIRMVKDGDKEIPLHACAGIAIAGTKTPFYQMYEISEELCSRSKKAAYKEHDDAANAGNPFDMPNPYIDFALISSSGMMKEFDEFLRLSYSIKGKLNKGGPYKIDGTFEELVSNASVLKGWSGKKRHEFRTALGGHLSDMEVFEKQLKLTNPNWEIPFDRNTNTNEYYDTLELIDFYLIN